MFEYLLLFTSGFNIIGYLPEIISLITKSDLNINIYVWYIWTFSNIFSMIYVILNNNFNDIITSGIELILCLTCLILNIINERHKQIEKNKEKILLNVIDNKIIYESMNNST